VLESRLGLDATGSRCDRYLRVVRKLDRVRKRAVKKPDRVSDRELELVRRAQRHLDEAEDRYWQAQLAAASARASLTRQVQAQRTAAAGLR